MGTLRPLGLQHLDVALSARPLAVHLVVVRVVVLLVLDRLLIVLLDIVHPVVAAEERRGLQLVLTVYA